MNSRTRQINKETNDYVKKFNERLPKIRHCIMNPDEYSDDAQLLTEISMLYRETTEYVQAIGLITETDIIENAKLVDEWLERLMTTHPRKIKTNRLEEIEDRAVDHYRIPIERLRSMAAPDIERLYDANYENMYVPDTRDYSERIRDHQEYEYALVVTEYRNQEPVRYAIYKGTREECNTEHNRFEESKRSPVGYRQNGNGTRRKRPIT